MGKGLQSKLLLACLVVLSEGRVPRGADELKYAGKNTFSPTGRQIQQEYVESTMAHGPMCLGMCCQDGVALASLRSVRSEDEKTDGAAIIEDGESVFVQGSRLQRVDSHCAVAIAGLPADARSLTAWIRAACQRHRRRFGEPIRGEILAAQLAYHVHATSLSWGTRSFANAVMIATIEGSTNAESQMHIVRPDGTFLRCHAFALGEGAANAIIELSGHVDGCSTGRYAEDTALLFPSKKSIPATADTRTLFTTILAGRHHSNELDDDSGGGGNDDDEASHPSTRENDGVQPQSSSVLPTLHTHVKADFGTLTVATTKEGRNPAGWASASQLPTVSWKVIAIQDT